MEAGGSVELHGASLGGEEVRGGTNASRGAVNSNADLLMQIRAGRGPIWSMPY
jgi:hypothetical protein